MSAAAIFLRHQALRWVVPASVAGAIGLAATGVFSAQASTKLPPRSAAQLLADIKSTEVDALSGTVVSTARLGLPELPTLATSAGGSATSMMGLLSGSNTARIWYAGPDKQRFALLDSVGETDVFHNGRDVWQYSSSTKTVTHLLLPAESADKPSPATPTLTPQQLAERALAAIGPTTIISTDANRRVADRSAYELVLTPRDTTSRVRTVKIAVDGEKKIPVSVQIFARADTATPSLDVSFTRLSFAAPDNNNFAFTPSKNAKVVEQKITSADQLGAHAHAGLTGDSQFTSVGKGWTTVGIARTGDLLGSAGGSAQKKAQSDALRTLGALPRVSGAWGSGRLFDSKLVTALFTDDGRVIFGAVDPQVLYATAASHK